MKIFCRKNLKAILTVFLFAFVFSMTNFVSVQATEIEQTEENYSWSIDAKGHLYVWGEYYQPIGENVTYEGTAPWGTYYSEIKTATVNLTGKSESLAGMFEGLYNLISIEFINLDTSQVTNMNCMFAGCNKLETIDLSKFDTENVTSFYGMFSDCNNLKTLELGHFDTSNVTDMSYMFYECSNLTTLNLRSFDTSKVTNMSRMFYRCSSLKSIDLSSFDTSNLTNINGMFQFCIKIKILDLSHFDLSSLENIGGGYGGYVFDYMDSLDILILPKSPILIPFRGNFYDSNGNLLTAAPANVEGISTYYHKSYAESACFTNGHDYAEPYFAWNTFPDVKLVSKCVRTDCQIEKDDVIELKADVQIKSIINATVDKEGSITYIATAEFRNVKYTDELTITIPCMDKDDEKSMSQPADTETPEEQQGSAGTKEEAASISKVKPVGYTFIYQGAKYKVTKIKGAKGEVEYVSPVEKTKKTVTIPATIKSDGITYKVTSIAKNAFKNNKKLTKVTIGKNMIKIGGNAFYGCKKLKTIKINSKKLKSVGKNAIKGIHKKAKIDVPNSKRKTYKKLFNKKTGYKNTMSIK